jgi:hypothetical protein
MYNWQKKRSRYWGVPSKLYREKNLLAAKEKPTYADLETLSVVRVSWWQRQL